MTKNPDNTPISRLREWDIKLTSLGVLIPVILSSCSASRDPDILGVLAMSITDYPPQTTFDVAAYELNGDQFDFGFRLMGGASLRDGMSTDSKIYSPPFPVGNIKCHFVGATPDEAQARQEEWPVEQQVDLSLPPEGSEKVIYLFSCNEL